MEMTATLGRANRLSGPGGVRNASMSTTPPAVAMLVRAYPGSPGGPGGMAKGIPNAKGLGATGVSCTVTTFPEGTVTMTGPRAVCTVSRTTQVSLPTSQLVAARAGDVAKAVGTPAARPATRSNATRRPVAWRASRRLRKGGWAQGSPNPSQPRGARGCDKEGGAVDARQADVAGPPDEGWEQRRVT